MSQFRVRPPRRAAAEPRGPDRTYRDPQQFAQAVQRVRRRKKKIPWRVTPEVRDRFLECAAEEERARESGLHGKAEHFREQIRALPGFPNDLVDEYGMEGEVQVLVEYSKIHVEVRH